MVWWFSLTSIQMTLTVCQTAGLQPLLKNLSAFVDAAGKDWLQDVNLSFLELVSNVHQDSAALCDSVLLNMRFSSALAVLSNLIASWPGCTAGAAGQLEQCAGDVERGGRTTAGLSSCGACSPALRGCRAAERAHAPPGLLLHLCCQGSSGEHPSTQHHAPDGSLTVSHH